ncbi:MAG: hypothetical protein U0528_08225 [Anaerolineae bacterium]|nr:hypothetical protein [Anaerolineae bacterium]
MGSTQIVRELMYYIQGETHPIYRAELSRRSAFNIPFDALAAYALLLLLLLAPILTCVESQFGFRVANSINSAILLLLIASGGVLSLGWTVPLTLLGGQGIVRERAHRTWDLLLTTPYSTETILLVKSASSIRRLWTLVLALVVFGTLIALFFAAPVFWAMGAEINGHVVYGIVLMLFGIVAIIVEHLQELALATTLGIVIALSTSSQRMALLFGLAGGILIRMLQVILTFALVPTSPAIQMQNVIVLNLLAGSATILSVIPAFPAVLFVLTMIIGRELLVRQLFRWTVRHASGVS